MGASGCFQRRHFSWRSPAGRERELPPISFLSKQNFDEFLFFSKGLTYPGALGASAPAYPRPTPTGDLISLKSADSGFGPSLLSQPGQVKQAERERVGKIHLTFPFQAFRTDRLERIPERSLERERNIGGLDRSSVALSESSLGMERLTLNSSSNRIPNSTCFVFYLPPSATNDTLRQLFMRYGTVLNAYVAMDKVTNRTRGFGFVDFSTPAEAQAAVAGLDKYPLEGKFLSVSIKV